MEFYRNESMEFLRDESTTVASVWELNVRIEGDRRYPSTSETSTTWTDGASSTGESRKVKTLILSWLKRIQPRRFRSLRGGQTDNGQTSIKADEEHSSRVKKSILSWLNQVQRIQLRPLRSLRRLRHFRFHRHHESPRNQSSASALLPCPCKADSPLPCPCQADSPLLTKLAADTLANITDYLTPMEYLLFTHTCYPVWRALSRDRKESHDEAVRLVNQAMLPRDIDDWPTEACSTRYEYQAMLARDDPNSWACTHCADIHGVQLSDMPNPGLSRRYSDRHDKLELTKTVLCFYEEHHVQLALKYSRMLYENEIYEYNKSGTEDQIQPCSRPGRPGTYPLTAEHIEYLKRLLSPRSQDCVTTLEFRSFFNGRYTLPPRDGAKRPARVIYSPRIVEDDYGEIRFISQSTVRFYAHAVDAKYLEKTEDQECREKNAPVIFGTLGDIEVCPHLSTHLNERRGNLPWMSLLFQHHHPRLGISLLAAFRGDYRGDYDIDARPEYNGKCRRCRVDYSVRVAHHMAEIRVWKDLGVETYLPGIEWLSHLPKPPGEVNDTPTVSHYGGSIRWLYENQYINVFPEDDAELDAGNASTPA